ncbi:hypothetical protein DH2020_018854 [Rehmannia glutinosa]|uniref:FHA domain-containing protein n=1 Tax=Rehmannia glutinosa TaxID=99300 RepID=A0ABR0WNN4_REHGL
MSNSTDSSFSFQNKRRQQFKLPTPPHKKSRKNTVIEAVLGIKTLGLPLISRSTGQLCESLRLVPYKPYTIGRKLKLCDFIFIDRRVSKRHCQLYFDYLEKKIYLSDGLFLDYSRSNDYVSSFRAKVSTNGAFVNGVRISGVVELRVGDVVWLVCGNGEAFGLRPSIGFLVEKAVFVEEVDYRSLNQLNSCSVTSVHSKQTSFTLKCSSVLDNTGVLLSWCRNILCSDDPVSYIRKCIFLNQKEGIDFFSGNVLKKCSHLLLDNGFEFCSNSGLHIGCHKRKRVYSRELEAVENSDFISRKEIIVVSEENTEVKCANIVTTADADTARQTGSGVVDVQHAAVAIGNSTGFSLGKQEYSQCRELLDDKNCGGCILPPGKKFYLNRLQFGGQDIVENDDVVSLPELLHPIESLKRVFIATFTSDILWFLSYCKIPPHLPVTIACHSGERYPPFPEVIAFNNDRKNSGIGCHHPKLFVLQREDRLRVVVTSANLVEKQWHNVTNTVWWQDFPRLNIPNCLSLFSRLSAGEINVDSKCDFAAQLAGFMASLVGDVPSQAHWILELIKYDFKGAAGYLVTSVPGIYSHRSPYVYESKFHLVGDKHKLESCGGNFLSSVEASVVGISHVYRASADSNGEHLKKLALFLGKCHENMDGMSEIVLRRETNIPADGNAVSVLIPNPEDFSVGDLNTLGFLMLPSIFIKSILEVCPVTELLDGMWFIGSAGQLVLGLNHEDIYHIANGVRCRTYFVQLGFLPRDVAKWVAPLSDIGLFAFSAYIHPKEVLTTALEGSNKKVKLILYVYAGPSFSAMSEFTQLEHVSAICSLLHQVGGMQGSGALMRFCVSTSGLNLWNQSSFFGSSSVGSVNAQFLAAFSAAAGKRSVPFSDSENPTRLGLLECQSRAKNPSISIIFPTIASVKNNRSGIMASRRILCFSERLENVGILHDAIPYPRDRVGFPMHVKPNHSSYAATSTDPLSHLLRRLPPTLSLSLAIRRRSSATTTTAMIISLSDPTPSLHSAATQMLEILDIMLHEVKERLTSLGIGLEVSEAIMDLICQQGYDRSYGARPLRRAVTQIIEDLVSESLLSGDYKPGDIALILLDDSGDASGRVRGLPSPSPFENDEGNLPLGPSQSPRSIGELVAKCVPLPVRKQYESLCHGGKSSWLPVLFALCVEMNHSFWDESFSGVAEDIHRETWGTLAELRVHFLEARRGRPPMARRGSISKHCVSF